MAALSELGEIAKAQEFDYGKHTGDAIRALGGEPRVRDKHYQSYASAKQEEGRRLVPKTAAAGALIGGGAGYAVESSRRKSLSQGGAKPVAAPKGRIAAATAAGALVGGAALGAVAQSNRKKVERGLKTTAHRRTHDARIVGLSDAVRDASIARERKRSSVAKSWKDEISDPLGTRRLKQARKRADNAAIDEMLRRAFDKKNVFRRYSSIPAQSGGVPLQRSGPPQHQQDYLDDIGRSLMQARRRVGQRGLAMLGAGALTATGGLALEGSRRRSAADQEQHAVAKSLRTKALRTEMGDPLYWRRLKQSKENLKQAQQFDPAKLEGGPDMELAGRINRASDAVDAASKKARIRTSGAAGALAAGAVGGGVYASRTPQRRARRFERAVAATGTGM